MTIYIYIRINNNIVQQHATGALQAHRAMDRAGTEGNDNRRDVPNSPQAGHFDATSPSTQSHAVPDWLSSPGRAPGSKRVSSESSSPALPLPGLLGHADRADSISPGSLHRLNVFSAPGTRHISSEGSGDGGPTQAAGEAEDAVKQELYQQQRTDVVLPQQNAQQVIEEGLSSCSCLPCAANSSAHSRLCSKHSFLRLAGLLKIVPCRCAAKYSVQFWLCTNIQPSTATSNNVPCAVQQISTPPPPGHQLFPFVHQTAFLPYASNSLSSEFASITVHYTATAHLV